MPHVLLVGDGTTRRVAALPGFTCAGSRDRGVTQVLKASPLFR